LTPVEPCQSCAHDYNPDALSGAKTQNPQDDELAIDGQRSTAWITENYYSGSLQKPGVGLYVDMGKPVNVREMVVYTQTPGWRGQIWGSDSPPDPNVFTVGPGGWTQLAQVPSMQKNQTIRLNTGGTAYRYYLVWITSLPPNMKFAAINEIELYQLTR
jgi:hypothetical protein